MHHATVGSTGRRGVRTLVAATAAAAALGLVGPAAASAATPAEELRATIAAQLAQGPAASGAYVVDVDSGEVVIDDRADARRLSASVTKLYTTSTALLRLGADRRLSTDLLGAGRRSGATWTGDLFLRGAGDFTFGTAAFARKAYGSDASVERLAAQLRRSGIRHVTGRVLGDATLYRDNGGTEFGLVLCRDPLFGRGCPYGVAGRFERPIPNGPRTPIGFNRGLENATSADPQKRPAQFAARGLTRALRDAGVRVDGRPGAARTPAGARVLAATSSPTLGRLAGLINKPSDNYAADATLRLLGARLAGNGSAAGGARVVSRTIADRFGIAPEIVSGSGETLQDRTSPKELVRLLTDMREQPEGRAFARSLSLAGRDGTLRRFSGTVADGRCQLKDGTRVDPVRRNTTLNVTGYCTSESGRTFAFAVMMNGMRLEFVPPDRIESPAYALQDRIVNALAGYRGAPQASAAASPRDAALTRSIRRALGRTEAPGAIVGVWQQGRRPYVRTFGVRDTATRRPMRTDLYSRIGSVTKTFTVTALLQLVEQGRVALDDPISKYVPGVTSGDRITLRQLASMRSGIVNYSVVPAFDRLLTDEPHRSWTPSELLSYAIGEPLLFAPGTGMSYSNTNTILLGLVVEQVSGQRLGAYIRSHITQPLGMRQTSFPNGTAFPSPHPQGYANSTPDRRTANATGWNPTWTWAAGQMVSTLRDLRIWAPALATGRGLLSPRTQRIRAASVAGGRGPITYGLGMFNVSGWLGHNGSLPGYQTLSLYRPQTKTTIVALINTDIESDGLAPSTIVGEAITRVISPRNVYTLPAAPPSRDAAAAATAARTAGGLATVAAKRRGKGRRPHRPRVRVNAGRDRRIAVGHSVRLRAIVRAVGRGRAARGGTARWSFHRAVPRRAAKLASPTGRTARFTPTRPGRYTLRFTHGSGSRATTDSVELTATPGPLVPIDAFGTRDRRGITIGDRFYPLAGPRGYSGTVMQVVVLDRRTLAERSYKAYTDRDQLARDLTALIPARGDRVNAPLVVVGAQWVNGRIQPDNAQQYRAIGVRPLDQPSGTFSAVGIPGMRAGEAYQSSRYEPRRPNGIGLRGYLTPDEYLNYGFVPAGREEFRFAPQPGASCDVCAPGGGFHLQVYDAMTLEPQPDRERHIATNAHGVGVAGLEEKAREMATMLEQLGPYDLVTIESYVYQQAGDVAPLGPIGRATMDRLARAVASVGGTRDVFNQAALRTGTAARGERLYTLVGWSGAGEGAGAEAGSGINGAPASPTLAGTWRPNRQSQFRPAADSDSGDAAGDLAGMVMQPPSQDWKCGRDASRAYVSCARRPRVAAAIAAIGAKIPLLGSNPRRAYGLSRWNGSELTGVTTAVGNVRYADVAAPGFDRDDFDAAQGQLLEELSQIGIARGYMDQLSATFTDQRATSFVDVQTIADGVYESTRRPDTQTAFRMIELTKILLSLAGPFTHEVSGEISELIDLGQWAVGAEEDGGPTYEEVSIRAHELARTVDAQLQRTSEQFQSLGDIIVSDPVKLAWFGTWGGCNPAANDRCPAALAWGVEQQKQTAATISRGVERLAYEELMPLGYSVFKLNIDSPEGRGIATGHRGPWVRPPALRDYICSDLYSPWRDVPAKSSAVLVDAVDPSAATSPNGMWIYQIYVMAQSPGVADQHAVPPPDTILDRLFDPVSDSTDPRAGGLGVVPQELMGTARPSYWEDYRQLEADKCKWGM